MTEGWGQDGDWSLRIVRIQGAEPIVWHVIIDEPDHELEVTQCSAGRGAWVDLAPMNGEAGDLAWLGHLCPECARGLGAFAAGCLEEADRGR